MPGEIERVNSDQPVPPGTPTGAAAAALEATFRA